jgi:hypothetical protein
MPGPYSSWFADDNHSVFANNRGGACRSWISGNNKRRRGCCWYNSQCSSYSSFSGAAATTSNENEDDDDDDEGFNNKGPYHQTKQPLQTSTATQVARIVHDGRR